MRLSLPPQVAAVLLLVGQLVALQEPELDPEDLVPLQLINFNFDTVRVIWNASQYPGTNFTFSYNFGGGGGVMSPCPRYTVDQGYTSGCVVEVETKNGVRDVLLEFSLLNKTHAFLNRSEWISYYLKPSSPKNLSFWWHPEAVTVTCSSLPYGGLLYEIQHKSNFDSEWQSTEKKTCSITVGSLDPDKCYYFRARVKTMESRYGPDTHPSDWSEVTHWQKGRQTGSCQQEAVLVPKFVFASCLVALLMVSALLLFLWHRQRVKNFLIPSVPDPKFTFPGLFEDHRGNFQEWIRFRENVADVNKVESEEEACALEEMPVGLPVKAKPATPAVDPLHPQARGGEALGPCRLPQRTDAVALGSCQQEAVLVPKFVFASCLVALLMVSALLLFLWHRQRVKNFLIPSVPDPKFTFPGLFEDHRGNFQEWIRFRENVADVNKVESEEEACALEEMPVGLPVKAKPATPAVDPLHPQARGGEALGPCRLPQRTDAVALGDFSFVVNDNAYVVL